MNKGKKIKWFLIVPAVILVYSVVMSLCRGKETLTSYFIVPLYHIINIFIAIFFAYYLTQARNDERKKREILDGLISSILNDITDSRMYNISCESDVDYIRITQRSVKNKMDLISRLLHDLNLPLSVTQSKDYFDFYWSHVSENISSIVKLQNDRKLLMNQISIISDKLDELRVNIYIK